MLGKGLKSREDIQMVWAKAKTSIIRQQTP